MPGAPVRRARGRVGVVELRVVLSTQVALDRVPRSIGPINRDL